MANIAFARSSRFLILAASRRIFHFKIKTPGRDPWTTQLYIKGYPSNQRDGIYRGIGDAKERESVTMDFAPIKDSRIVELAAKFDIVLGFTPEE